MAASLHDSLLTDGNTKPTKRSHTTTLRRPSLYERWVTNGWLFELLSVLVGLVAIIGLCLVLRKYDGKPNPRANRVSGVNFTVNTLVAILSTISRAALLVVASECICQLKWRWYLHGAKSLEDLDIFDQASRGAWGGLKLLWTVNVRQIASLGAFLAIGGLAVDPLSQQLVHSGVIVVPGEIGDATLQAALKFKGATQDTGAIIGNDDEAANPTLLVRGAVKSAIYSQGFDVPYIVPTCSSGNCTWPSYRSLAVCNRVANVTSSLKTTSATILDDKDDIVNTTKWSLTPHNFIYASAERLSRMNTTAKGEQIKAADRGTETPMSLDFADSIAFKDSPRPIADTIIIYTTTRSDPIAFAAVEFLLEWCVRDFTTKVEEGQASTKAGDKIFRDFSKPDPERSTAQIVARPDGIGNGKPVYEVDFDGHYSLQMYLAQLFDGSVDSTSGTADGTEARLRADNEAMLALFQPFDVTGTLFDGKDEVEGRNDGIEGLQKILDNISTSMTNLLQTQSDPENLQTIRGTVNVPQTFIEVQWGWIAAPITLLVGTMVLLFAAILSSVRGRSPEIWKSSSLPLLTALDRDTYSKGPGGMATTSLMEDWAKGVRVQLSRERDLGAWRLTEQGHKGEKEDSLEMS